MKVLNLRCAHGHGFEGWFGSEADYQSQQERGLIECPVCNDKAIVKLPSAPRLNVSKTRELAPIEAAKPPQDASSERQVSMHSVWARAVEHVLKNTVDVGDKFAEEARRIHYGEAEERAIRGRASQQDTDALRDEGIEVFALPMPGIDKGTLQ